MIDEASAAIVWGEYKARQAYTEARGRASKAKLEADAALKRMRRMVAAKEKMGVLPNEEEKIIKGIKECGGDFNTFIEVLAYIDAKREELE